MSTTPAAQHHDSLPKLAGNPGPPEYVETFTVSISLCPPCLYEVFEFHLSTLLFPLTVSRILYIPPPPFIYPLVLSCGRRCYCYLHLISPRHYDRCSQNVVQPSPRPTICFGYLLHKIIFPGPTFTARRPFVLSSRTVDN